MQGSRRRPYVVTVVAPPPTEAQWAKVDDAFRSRLGFAARLLAGEVPTELEEAFASAGVELIPARWETLGASCTCPDWENPCKHIAAVLYVFADKLDSDPWMLLAWRGRTREELLAHLHREPDARRLPPWWPLTPTRTFEPAAASVRSAEPPDPPARVFARLAPLAIEFGDRPLGEILSDAYERIYRDDLPTVLPSPVRCEARWDVTRHAGSASGVTAGRCSTRVLSPFRRRPQPARVVDTTAVSHRGDARMTVVEHAGSTSMPMMRRWQRCVRR